MKIYVYIIIVAVLVGLLILIDIFIKRSRVKIVRETLEELCKKSNYKFAVSIDKRYDFSIENDTTKVIIKTIFIPANSSITINSKTTWCLRYGGGNREGRNYPNKEYLTYLNAFLCSNFMTDKNSNKKIQKCVLIYPNTEVVLKYLNESEIKVIKVGEAAYDVKPITFKQLSSFDSIINESLLK